MGYVRDFILVKVLDKQTFHLKEIVLQRMNDEDLVTKHLNDLTLW